MEKCRADPWVFSTDRDGMENKEEVLILIVHLGDLLLIISIVETKQCVKSCYY